jgi:hypothetical protein
MISNLTNSTAVMSTSLFPAIFVLLRSGAWQMYAGIEGVFTKSLSFGVTET